MSRRAPSAPTHPTRVAPPLRRRRSGRLPLIVGLAAALLLAIGAVAAIVLLGDRGGAGSQEAGLSDSGQPDPSGAGDPAGGPDATTGTGPEPSASDRPAPGLSGGEPLQGGFTTAPDLCAAGDFSPVFGIVDQIEQLNDYERTESGLYQRSCVFTLGSGDSQGSLSADVTVGDGAADRYQDAVAAEGNRDPAREPVDGDWDESTALVYPAGDGQAEVRVLARDGVLVVSLSTFVIGDAADVDALRDAQARVADWIRDEMRS